MPPPIRYRLGADGADLLAFRTEEVDGRLLLSLVPDVANAHPLDVVACFLDEPRLQLAGDTTK